MQKQWFVYVLINSQGITYTGITYDISPQRRLDEHNKKRVGGAKFTRHRGPWSLLYIENGFADRSHASQREYQIKKDRKLKAMIKEGLSLYSAGA